MDYYNPSPNFLSNDNFTIQESSVIIREMEDTKKQRDYSELLPYQYKKGQSGNPSGRPKGASLKEYVKSKFTSMTDDEREEFLNGLPKEIIWKLAEGNPANNTDITSGGKPIIQLAQDIIEKNDIDTKPESNS